MKITDIIMRVSSLMQKTEEDMAWIRLGNPSFLSPLSSSIYFLSSGFLHSSHGWQIHSGIGWVYWFKPFPFQALAPGCPSEGL